MAISTWMAMGIIERVVYDSRVERTEGEGEV